MPTPRLLLFVYMSLGSVLTLASFILVVTFAQSSSPSFPPSADPAFDFQLPDQGLSQDLSQGLSQDLGYDKPIIFFREDTRILVLYPNGDIVHRGRKVTTDRDVVRAMQEILALSPCRAET